MKKQTILLALLWVTSLLYAQPPGTVSARMAQKADPVEEDYQTRIKQETINGVYIPRDLEDAFRQLDVLTNETSRQKFKEMNEADARHKLHFSLGRWIIHNWGFYEGSRLSYHLNQSGLFEPDDMARFIILTYHRRLNRRPLQADELIVEFQEFRRKEREERLRQGKVIHEETRIKKPDGKQKQ